ncbi:NADH ubiquinone oxidoreductase subunit NDUFA12-domain-containing protein [Chaetomium fimeti]|jgi:NADH:ubiquinone oxidoreductase subunit|uniref:NADH dehydrogenase [ubiquinone] 1 alpha subcomplex subunit n=1 Tax=Chaetomium fimeti TaxID=1854472 RepID=A0AAE0HIW7_9PEZI|nr:NADH ubiquinone oxidoreductase subunit NDUFA12-domain-containing protein [Chaetomium fimeti]
MSSISRTLRNLRKVGIKDFWHQLNYIGDTKAGVLVGTDKFGNKFFEDKDELPLRTRWVDFAKHDFDSAQIEPLWHAWIAYTVDTPPTQDPIMETGKRAWSPKDQVPNRTATLGSYKTYSTTKPKINAWEPFAAPR